MMNKTMKTVWNGLLALGMAASVSAQDYTYRSMEIPLEEGVNIEKVKDAGQECVKELMTEFMKQKAGEDLKLYQVLPFAQDIDGSYLTSQLQNQFAAKGRSVGYERYTRNETMFNQILKEISWGEQFGDIMDPATVQEFGRLSGVEGLLVPRLSVTTIDGVTTMRMSLQGYEVETGKSFPFAHEAKRTITPAPVPVPPVNYWKWIIPILIILVVIWVIAKFLKTLSRPR